jgi:hypothetical protein
MATGFEKRVVAALEATGVPLNTVLTDGIRIEPHLDGYLLRWESAATITTEQAIALLTPDPDAG